MSQKLRRAFHIIRDLPTERQDEVADALMRYSAVHALPVIQFGDEDQLEVDALAQPENTIPP